jgi:hypothetical protein
VPDVPLWRSRDFVLLQAGQLLSTAGTQSTTIASPLLVLVVAGRRQGLSSAEIGAVLLVGSTISSLVRRSLPVRTILLLELWTWTGGAFSLVWPNVDVLAAGSSPRRS